MKMCNIIYRGDNHEYVF